MSAQELKSPWESSASPKSQAHLVSCSVCLEAVTDGGERSIAKLKCGHHFHLDCIGSAFNAKGRMQCPNCRHVEQGLWLYGNGCFVHEDFIDDLNFEEDAENLSSTSSFDLGHTPWCPHLGSYGHLAMDFGDLDEIGNGYVANPLFAVRHGSMPAAAVGHICPYLAAQGFSIAGSSHRVEEFVGLHVGYRPSRNSHRGARSSSRMQQASVASASSNMQAAFEGSSHTSSPNGRLLHPSTGRLPRLGFLVGSPQVPHNTGASQRLNSNAQFRAQANPHNTQVSHSYSLLHPQISTGVSRNRWSWLGEQPLAYRMMPQVLSSERVWMIEPAHDYSPWMSPASPGQNMGLMLQSDRVSWVTNSSQTYPWTRGIYPPLQAAYGASNNQWWAWVPPSLGNHGQTAMPLTAPNTYTGGHFLSSGEFQRPSHSFDGFLNLGLEGSYRWVLH